MTNIRPYWQNFINGEWVDGSSCEIIVITNPATNEPISEVARAMPEDLDVAVRGGMERV